MEEVVHSEWPPGRVDARIPVTIKLKDGRTFSKENASPREPTMNQLLDRYREAAGGILTPEQTKRSMELLLDMENSRDVSEIMGLLTAKS